MALLLSLLLACSDYGFGSKDDVSDPDGDTAGPTVDSADTGGGGFGDTGPVGDDTGGGDGVPDSGDTAETGGDTGVPEDLCDYAARTTGYLDTLQVPGDGRVLYCHNQGGGHFTEINTDISSCEPHLDHRYDVFPTTGCDS